jgi:hypothetical protein
MFSLENSIFEVNKLKRFSSYTFGKFKMYRVQKHEPLEGINSKRNATSFLIMNGEFFKK